MFFPSGIAAAAGSGGGQGRFRMKGALITAAGGFSGTSPTGWTISKQTTGRYLFTHNMDPKSLVVTFDNSSNTASFTACPSGFDTTSWTIDTYRFLDGGQQDGGYWIYVIEPVDDNTLFKVEINGNTGAIVQGTFPDGWSLVRTGEGRYTLSTGLASTDPRSVPICVIPRGKAAQANGAWATSNFSTGGTYLINTQRVADNAPQDYTFYVNIILGTPENVQAMYVLSTGVISGPAPTGWTASRSNTGIYSVNFNGLPADIRTAPRGGLFMATIAQSLGEECAQAFTTFAATVHTHRASDGGPADKNYYAYLLTPET